jgi:hypothetical protein
VLLLLLLHQLLLLLGLLLSQCDEAADFTGVCQAFLQAAAAAAAAAGRQRTAECSNQQDAGGCKSADDYDSLTWVLSCLQLQT